MHFFSFRSYWVGSVSWSPGGLFFACVLKRGSLLMLARLGGLLTLTSSGCNVDFGPAHFLPLHPLVTYRYTLFKGCRACHLLLHLKSCWLVWAYVPFLYFVLISVLILCFSMKSTHVYKEWGSLFVQLQFVCAGRDETAVFCDLAPTTVVSHCVWWLHGHSDEGVRQAFSCPVTKNTSEGHKKRSWEDQPNAGWITGN